MRSDAEIPSSFKRVASVRSSIKIAKPRKCDNQKNQWKKLKLFAIKRLNALKQEIVWWPWWQFMLWFSPNFHYLLKMFRSCWMIAQQNRYTLWRCIVIYIWGGLKVLTLLQTTKNTKKFKNELSNQIFI